VTAIVSPSVAAALIRLVLRLLLVLGLLAQAAAAQSADLPHTSTFLPCSLRR
jgi:hypothetical protein